MAIEQGIKILFNSTLLANIDDINIISNTRQEVTTRTSNLIKAVELMALKVNKGKLKYLVMTRKTRDNSDQIIENYTF